MLVAASLMCIISCSTEEGPEWLGQNDAKPVSDNFASHSFLRLINLNKHIGFSLI